MKKRKKVTTGVVGFWGWIIVGVLALTFSYQINTSAQLGTSHAPPAMPAALVKKPATPVKKPMSLRRPVITVSEKEHREITADIIRIMDEHGDDIRKVAKEQVVYWPEFLATVRVESQGKLDAISKKGAKGIMQPMGKAAKDCYMKLTTDKLGNMNIGGCYLRLLDLRYGYSAYVMRALAYNEGPDGSTVWLAKHRYAENHIHVAKIVKTMMVIDEMYMKELHPVKFYSALAWAKTRELIRDMYESYS